MKATSTPGRFVCFKTPAEYFNDVSATSDESVAERSKKYANFKTIVQKQQANNGEVIGKDQMPTENGENETESETGNLLLYFIVFFLLNEFRILL